MESVTIKSSLRAFFLPSYLPSISESLLKRCRAHWLATVSLFFFGLGAAEPDAYGYRRTLRGGVPYCSAYSLGVCLPEAVVCPILACLKLLLPASGVLRSLPAVGGVHYGLAKDAVVC